MKELTLAQLQLSEETGRLRTATVGQNSISAALAFDYDNGRRFISLGDCDTARLTALYDPESKQILTRWKSKPSIINTKFLRRLI